MRGRPTGYRAYYHREDGTNNVLGIVGLLCEYLNDHRVLVVERPSDMVMEVYTGKAHKNCIIQV